MLTINGNTVRLGGRTILDRAMFDPSSAAPELAWLPIGELSRRRAKLAAELEAAEARWLAASEKLEQAAA